MTAIKMTGCGGMMAKGTAEDGTISASHRSRNSGTVEHGGAMPLRLDRQTRPWSYDRRRVEQRKARPCLSVPWRVEQRRTRSCSSVRR
jgi:hypothetical protein